MCTGAPDTAIPKTGGPVRGDGRVGFGVARGFAVVRGRRTDVGVTPTSEPLTNLQNLGFVIRAAACRRVVVRPDPQRIAISVRSGTPNVGHVGA